MYQHSTKNKKSYEETWLKNEKVWLNTESLMQKKSLTLIPVNTQKTNKRHEEQTESC